MRRSLSLRIADLVGVACWGFAGAGFVALLASQWLLMLNRGRYGYWFARFAEIDEAIAGLFSSPDTYRYVEGRPLGLAIVLAALVWLATRKAAWIRWAIIPGFVVTLAYGIVRRPRCAPPEPLHVPTCVGDAVHWYQGALLLGVATTGLIWFLKAHRSSVEAATDGANR